MCCLAAATIGVAQNTPGVFYAPVSADLGVALGTYSFFGTAQLLAIALVSLAVPRLLRTFGIKWIILFGMVCMTMSTVVLAFSSALPVIYLCGAVRGVGAAICANIPITMILNNWFEASNGTVTSIALSFSGLTGAICSPILAQAIDALGWRVAYLVQAALIAACMLPPFVMRLHLTPEEEGLAAYGADAQAVPAPPTDDDDDVPLIARAEPEAPAPVSTGFAFASLAFAAVSAFIFLHCLITGLAQHISGYAVSIGFEASFGALLLSLSMVGNIASKLLIGILSDRLGALMSSILMIVLNIVSLALIYLGARTGSAWMLMVGAVTYGSVYSVAAVGIALLTKQFFGQDNYAQAFPVISFIGAVGCAVAIPAIGYVFDFTGAYDVAVIACVVIDVVDLVLLRVASRAAAA
jgi:MFS family permease